jgi:hypothetical protein
MCGFFKLPLQEVRYVIKVKHLIFSGKAFQLSLSDPKKGDGIQKIHLSA